jgi:DNA-directed RNA polymerase specialized sigma24 family protein
MDPSQPEPGTPQHTVEVFEALRGNELRKTVQWVAKQFHMENPESEAAEAVQHAYGVYLLRHASVDPSKLHGFLFSCARNRLADMGRRRKREVPRRSDPKRSEPADVEEQSDPHVVQPIQGLLDEEEAELRVRCQTVIKRYFEAFPEGIAHDSIRFWLYGEPSAQDVMERYGVSRTALNHYIDKFLSAVAKEFGTLAEYLAAKRKRGQKRRGDGHE